MIKAKFDSIIHAPNRLQICSLLAPLDDAEFQFLRDSLEVYDSVLSKHIKQFEVAGTLNNAKKRFVVDNVHRII